MVTDVSLLQPSKALLPMLVTLLGIETDASLEQYWKSPAFIVVKLLGSETEVRPLQ